MKSVKAVLRGHTPREQDVEIDTHKHHYIVIHLADGEQVQIELFERYPGGITIRTTNQGCVIVPEAGNSIRIRGRGDR